MSDSPATIQITLNGEAKQIAAGCSVADLLRDLGVASFGVAVERNRAVVRRADHPMTVVQAGDCIEIVQFVGGG